MPAPDPHRSVHEHAQELLPRHAGGSLPAADRAALEAHLQECADCRAELAKEQRIAALLRDTALAPRSPEPALARLLSALPAGTAGRAPARVGLSERLAAWLHSLTAAPVLAGVAAITLVIGVSIAYRAPDTAGTPATDAYRVLGSAPLDTPARPEDIHLVLAPATSAARRQALLDTIGGTLVAGPNSAGALTVRIGTRGEPLALAEALRRLRREPEVLLAEAAAPLAMPHVGAEP